MQYFLEVRADNPPKSYLMPTYQRSSTFLFFNHFEPFLKQSQGCRRLPFTDGWKWGTLGLSNLTWVTPESLDCMFCHPKYEVHDPTNQRYTCQCSDSNLEARNLINYGNALHFLHVVNKLIHIRSVIIVGNQYNQTKSMPCKSLANLNLYPENRSLQQFLYMVGSRFHF